MYEHRSARLLPRHQFVRRVARHAAAVVLLLSVSLILGMAGYVGIAGMSWVDAFLNASMLLGGMGQITELRSDAAKIFAGMYALYAGLLFIASFVILIAPIAHRILHGLHVDEGQRKKNSA